MVLNDLYTKAKELDIAIYDRKLTHSTSFSHMDNGLNCYVALDYSRIHTSAEEKTILGHEVAHCVTGSFYNRYSPFDVRQKHENRATRREVLELIPIDELVTALRDPWHSVYDLSERFGVTEDFMRKALEIYRDELEAMM